MLEEPGEYTYLFHNYLRNGDEYEKSYARGEPIVQNVIKTTLNPGGADEKGAVSIEGVKAGKPGENQPVPRSDNDTAGATMENGNLAPTGNNPTANAATGTAQGTPADSAAGNNAAVNHAGASNNNGSGSATNPNDTGIEELKVNTPPDNQTLGQPSANQPASSTSSPLTQPAPAMPQTGAPAPPQSPDTQSPAPARPYTDKPSSHPTAIPAVA